MVSDFVDGAERVEFVDARLQLAVFNVGHPSVRNVEFAVVMLFGDVPASRLYITRR